MRIPLNAKQLKAEKTQNVMKIAQEFLIADMNAGESASLIATICTKMKLKKVIELHVMKK